MSQDPSLRPEAPPGLKHSGPGIASFIVSASSFVTGLGGVILFNLGREKVLMGPFCSCGMPTGLAGIILGIVGLALPNRKKMFAYFGLALGALNILINGILILTGQVD
jgi:hypothetical protein